MTFVLHLLKRHPFGVEAFFRRSLVLTYAFPKEVLLPLIGPGLTLDTYGEWAFLAIAMVETQALRPKGMPKWLGRDFFLSGYRIFSRFSQPGKQSLRGLRILRSDTNKQGMRVLGNLFTHYGYRHAEVSVQSSDTELEIRIVTAAAEADVHVVADLSSIPASLPEGSPFASMDDARTFAGPLPYTFDHEAETGKMIVVKGLRQAWNPMPVRVQVKQATFLDRPAFAGAKLANAFYVHDVPYAWKPGRLEAVA
jgi:Uncharacterized conserved protein (COG2071)